MKKIMFYLLLIVSSSYDAFASKEGILIMSDYSIHSNGIGSSGSIDVIGKQNKGKFVTLKIDAFGKEYNLTDSQLAKISNGNCNGIMLNYLYGYKGRVIYIQLQLGFQRGIQKKTLVVIPENGKIRIKNYSSPS